MITLSQREFQLLVGYISDYCGIDLKQKKHLIESRLNNHLVKLGFSNFTDFYRYLCTDGSGEAVSNVVDLLSTNHTYFMRERRHFDFFREMALPEVTCKVKNGDLRIWCAGCSTGEEPYTLAMIMLDFFGPQHHNWDTRILATDISSRVLQKARMAVYPAEGLQSLPTTWRVRYFQSVDQGKFKIIDQVKKQVIFRRFNLVESSFPFKQQFHIIFCRNVMIYFDAATKKELLNRFYSFLVKGGYLFIGQAESINWEQSRFNYVIPSVYRK
ncbi:MAG: protein-glutamate O-methyltransferase CheR [Heliobacteriaceae bacterium]|nr:protein-glutamate O-methyltransferase CheR [Heliobacteriaceae bacterium]MDD4587266.1 protein-glutamate O-methyltransferase CheR [Heliobacteriaceae bacterium]